MMMRRIKINTLGNRDRKAAELPLLLSRRRCGTTTTSSSFSKRPLLLQVPYYYRMSSSSFGGETDDLIQTTNLSSTTTTTFSSSCRFFSTKTTRHESSPREEKFISASIINERIVQLGKEKEWKRLLDLYKKKSSLYNNVNYATTMQQLSRDRSVDIMDPIFLEFMDDLGAKITTTSQDQGGLDWIQIRQFSNIVQCIGKMRLKSNRSARKIIEYAAKPDIASIITSEGNAMDLAVTCWGIARFGDFNSFATFFSPHVESQLERIFLVSPPQFLPRFVSNITWSCGESNLQSPKLVSLIEQNATLLVKDSLPHNVCDIARPLAKLQVDSPKFFHEIEKYAPVLIEKAKYDDVQAIIHIAWAFGKKNIQSKRFFGEIEKSASSIIEKASPAAVAHTAIIFSKLGIHSPVLFSNIEKRTYTLLKESQPEDLAIMALALATQGNRSETFWKGFMDNLENFLPQSGPSSISIVCYSIAIMDLAIEYPEKFQMLWSKALSFDPNSIPTEGCSQLVQSYLFVTAAGMKLQQPAIPTGVSADKVISPSQGEISELLTEIGFDHEQRVSPFSDDDEMSSFLPEGMLFINFACRARKIAIEFDRPFNFLRGLHSGQESTIKKGPGVAKHRFLERLGWTVYTIRYTDWNKAKDKEGKERLLRYILMPVLQ